MTMPAPGSGRIRLPENFPVTWPSLEAEKLFWFWDQMHHPHAVTPMTAALDGPAFSAGIGKAAEALYMPIRRFHVAAFNCYWYYGNEPFTGTPEELAERDKRLEAVLMERAPRCLRDWESVYLPEVIALNERLRGYPYAEASTKELADFLDEVCAIRQRQWELHFLAVFPAMGAAFQFAEMYEGVFGRPENNEHYRMLQGFPNKSVEAGQALYDLAQETKGHPEVVEIILESPVDGVLPALSRSQSGREMAERLRDYLDTYGWRSDQFELIDPSWREDPSPMLHNLRGYLREDATDPRMEQAKAATERERLVKEMLEWAPDQAAHNQLQMLVTIAQQYLPVQENHNFYIDQMNTVLLRLPVLETGRRLTASGVVHDMNDAFYLTPRELQEAAVDSSDGWAGLVTERRAERERWAKVVPPLFVGTAPEEEPPRADVMTRFFGLDGKPSREAKVITGHGASSGVVSGPAKVVRELSESDKLEPGDVLVCEMTMPPWTPLFSIVSAVVADSGGVLSHCAIVAREYGIPCVVGTGNGTQRIKDGQLVTVDGANGIIRLS